LKEKEKRNFIVDDDDDEVQISYSLRPGANPIKEI